MIEMMEKHTKTSRRRCARRCERRAEIVSVCAGATRWILRAYEVGSPPTSVRDRAVGQRAARSQKKGSADERG